MLEAMDNHLWTVENGTLYKNSVSSMTWEQVGAVADWEHTVAMVADGSYLWSIESDGTLFRTDKSGRFEKFGERGLLSEVSMIVALDKVLYAVENGTLYKKK